MSDTILTAGQVLTGVDGPPIRNGAVRVRGKTIVAVGPAADVVGTSDDDERIDLGRDATLLPGLVEAHEHLSGHDYYAIGDFTVREPDTMFALVATHHARRLVDQGITTARMVGAPGDIDLLVRRAIREGYVSGPNLYCAGRPLTMTGGHGSTSGVEIDGPDEARKAARTRIKLGCDLIKVIASGGVGITRPGEEPSEPQLTVSEMAAAVEVAHWAGKRVAAHADGVAGIWNALRAGVDTIEHGIYMNAEQARYMADHGIMLVPTLSTMHGIYNHGLAYGMPATWIPIAEAVLEPHRESFRHALDAGVFFAAGTDGFGDLVDEMILFTTYGMSNLRALQAATRDAALVIAEKPSFGSLEPGKDADVLAVAGDPAADLEALRNVELVMMAGRVVRRTGRPLTERVPAMA